jgi:hypothetical protein
MFRVVDGIKFREVNEAGKPLQCALPDGHAGEHLRRPWS